MKTWKSLIVACIVMAVSSPARAQKEVGNGGDAVVCYDDARRQHITSVEMFDYWEMNAILTNAGGIDLGGPGLSVKQKIDFAIKRLAGFDPELAEIVGKVAYAIESNIAGYLVTNVQLPEIDDATPRTLPTGNCFIEQFAVQWKEPTSGQRRFSIAARLYNSPATTNDARAGIILHEAIYRYAISRGHTNSDGTRYFNFAIASALLNHKDYGDYFRVLKEARFIDDNCELLDHPVLHQKVAGHRIRQQEGTSEVQYSDFPDLELCTSLVYDTPKMKVSAFRGSVIKIDLFWQIDHHEYGWQIYPTSGSSLSRPDRDGNWMTDKIFTEKPLSSMCSFTFCLTMTPDGAFTGIENDFSEPSPPRLDYFIRRGSQYIDCNGRNIQFDGKGEIIGCQLSAETTIQFQRQTVTLKQGGSIEFYENMRLRYFESDQPTTFQVPATRKTATVIGYARLNADGHLIAGQLQVPLIKAVLGKSITIKYAVFNDQGMLYVDKDERFPVSNALYQGSKMLNSGSEDALKSFCQQFDPRFIAGKITDFQDQYIVGTQQLYNPARNRLENKTDEYVSVATAVECRGNEIYVPY